MPMHIQVPFETIGGETVGVDSGLLRILELLRDLGVETQFSCQRNESRAYILASMVSVRPFEKLVKKGFKNDVFSNETKFIIDLFLSAKPRFELRRMKMKTLGNGAQASEQKIRIFIGKDNGFGIVNERSFCNLMGRRVTYRWPTSITPAVEEALEEIYEKSKDI